MKKFKPSRLSIEVAAKALNHPIRLQIIELLKRNQDGLAVHEIIEYFRNCQLKNPKNCIEQPIISAHLKILLRSEFVDKIKNGRERIYHLDTANLEYFDFLTEKWLTKDNTIGGNDMTPLSISLSPSETPFD